MSVSKRHTHAARARAERARIRNEATLVEHITRNEKISKKLTPETSKQPDAPVRENPYTRLLRKLDEDRQGQN